MRSFKYRAEPSGWSKRVDTVGKDGQRRICYVNDVHKAIHLFLADHLRPSRNLCHCEYKYFITPKRWGFEIGDGKAYLLLGDTHANVAMTFSPLLNEEHAVFELADPAFYTKLLAFLRLNELARTEKSIT